MKGIVLEVNEEEAIVLAKDGSFQVVPVERDQPLAVGDEVDIPAVSSPVVKHKRRFRYPAVALLVSSFIIILAVVGALVMWPDNTAVAYVQLDFNPSVELSVNRSMEVLSLTGINAEGKQLVQYMTDWSRHSLHNVLVNMLITAQDHGYLGEITSILVTTTLTDDKSFDQYDPLITEALQKAEAKLRESEAFYVYGQSAPKQAELAPPSDSHQIIFYRLYADQALREEALKAGIPLGKYALYRYAEQQGRSLLLEEVVNLSATELFSQLGDIESLFSPPHPF